MNIDFSGRTVDRHRRGARLRTRDQRWRSPRAVRTCGRATCSATNCPRRSGCARGRRHLHACARWTCATSAAVDALRRRRPRRRPGRVDILVNNAGGVLGQVGRPLEEVTPGEWQAIFDVNVTGAFYCAQAVAPGMKAARGGPHRQHLERRRPRHQPHRHPGLRVGQGGADRPHPAAGARAGAVGHHGQQHRARGSCGPIRRTERQWESYGADGQRGARRAHRAQAAGHPGRHRARACCSSRRTSRTGSPARCSPSTAASDGRSNAVAARTARRARAHPRRAGRVRVHPERQHRSRATRPT